MKSFVAQPFVLVYRWFLGLFGVRFIEVPVGIPRVRVR